MLQCGARASVVGAYLVHLTRWPVVLLQALSVF